MLLYPDILHKAQNEIDRVIGRERVPGINDRSGLPYIDAIVKETIMDGKVLPPRLRGGLNLSRPGHASLHDW